MSPDALAQLRFPIGAFNKPPAITAIHLSDWVQAIEDFPSLVRKLLASANDEKLSCPYRPDGWNTNQLVHHCADSHMNSFIRFKLSLTEDKPIIKPYNEAEWAMLPDVEGIKIDASMLILEGLHDRWATLLRSLTEHDLKKVFVHPEQGKEFSVEENIGVYAWHCNHHLAHMKLGLNSSGKYA